MAKVAKTAKSPKKGSKGLAKTKKAKEPKKEKDRKASKGSSKGSKGKKSGGSGNGKGKKKGKKGKAKPLTKREMELAKKKAEFEEAERVKREAEEAIIAKKKHDEELVLRASHLISSGAIIGNFDKIVFAALNRQKKLRDWETFIACRNIPDLCKLAEVNSYLTYWCVEMEDPDIKAFLNLAPEFLQLIEELHDFLEIPPENVSLDSIYELGLLYHQMIQYQQEYMDQCTYAITQDLTDFYDPEVGVFETIETIPQITHCLWGNIFTCPEYDGHEFNQLNFKFKIPEVLLTTEGIYRLVKTEYDHYSDSSQSYFAPGVFNPLKSSIDNWIAKLRENMKISAELKSPGVAEEAELDAEEKTDKKKKKGKKGKKGKSKKKGKKGKKGKGSQSENEEEDSQNKKGRKKSGKKSKKGKKGKKGGESGGESSGYGYTTTETEGEEGEGEEEEETEHEKEKSAKGKKMEEEEEEPAIKETKEERRSRRRKEEEEAEDAEFEYVPKDSQKQKKVASDEALLTYDDDDDSGKGKKGHAHAKKSGDSDSESDEGKKKGTTKQKKGQDDEETGKEKHTGKKAAGKSKGGSGKKGKKAGKTANNEDDDDDSNKNVSKAAKKSMAPIDGHKAGDEETGGGKAGRNSIKQSEDNKDTTAGGDERRESNQSGAKDVEKTSETSSTKKKSATPAKPKSKSKGKKSKGKKGKSKKKKKSKKGKKSKKSKKSKKGKGKKSKGSKGGKSKGSKKSKGGNSKRKKSKSGDEDDEEEGKGSRGRSKTRGKKGGKGKSKSGSRSRSKDKKSKGSSKSKSRSTSRGRSKTPKKDKKKSGKKGGKSKSKSRSSSKSKSRSRSKGKKGKKSKSRSRSKSKKKKKKDKSKSRERPKTEAELAKERERKEKAQFIPKLRDNELNLRNYAILGGVYNFSLLHCPPQPKDRIKWVMHLMEPEKHLKALDFVADYMPPPTAEQQETKKTPEEMEKEAKRQEEELQKLVLVDVDLPSVPKLAEEIDPEEEAARLKRLEEEAAEELEAEIERSLSKLIFVELDVAKTSLWFEPPTPVRWDEQHRIWSTEGFYDVKFNEDNLHLSFRTTKFGIMGFAHNRWTNFPYQSWELRPIGNQKVLFSLQAAMVLIEFTVMNDLICVSNLDNASNSKVVTEAILNKYMKPRLLIKTLRYHGLDMFPEFDSYAYVDGILIKDFEAEDHMYQCMAITSPAFNYQWSRWNLLAGRTKMVYQMRERHGTSTPANYSMVLNTPMKCIRIDCTEVSPNYCEDPISTDEFSADLLRLASGMGSDSAKDMIRTANAHHVEAVRILLAAVRPLSFS